MSLLALIPWLALVAYVLLRVRIPRELPERSPHRAPAALVSVIVPARNEAVNIEACVRSLAASAYPAFEILVVDDRSEDDTAARARAMEPGNARRLRVVEGDELPEGWLGKPWACWQGALEAKGEIFLFTDADTRHAPDLLDRAVAGLEEDGADLLTVLGRQIMDTFWERLVQPQIFLTLALRFPNMERTVSKGRWRDAIANGQFMLFDREAYEAVGGHRRVRGQVVEDMALAQVVVREGLRLSTRLAEDSFATRMYRSLGELVEGWSKNIVTGALMTVPAAIRPLVGPVSLAAGVAFWIAPPLAMAASLVGLGGPALGSWASTVVGLSVLFWAGITWRMGAPPWYGLLYPVGAAVGSWIFVRSWRQGKSVTWKGRQYLLGDIPEEV